MMKSIHLPLAFGLLVLPFFGCAGSSSSTGGTTSPSSPTCTQSLESGSGKIMNLGSVGTNCVTAANTGGATCASNQLPLVIGDTSATYQSLNSPQTSVKVCLPGSTTQCAIIDSILIDTGSSGLRLFPSAFGGAGSTLASTSLPGVTVTGQTGSLYECQGFLSGNMFGPVVTADVYMGGGSTFSKMVSGVSIQIADPTGANDSNCACPITAASGFGFNGIMGVGLATQDCGSYCVSAANDANVYFDCAGGSGGTCNNIGIAKAKQVTNPISLVTTDNNGVIVSFPSQTGGQLVASGTLTLGIDTETNNASTSATLYPVDQYGNFTTVYKSVNYGTAGPQDTDGFPTTLAFIDSGSNGLFFTDTITDCGSGLAGFYCPTSTQNLTGTVKGATGTNSSVISFAIADPNAALNANDYSIMTLGGSFGDASTAASDSNNLGFDWGIPFFMGRNVFVGFETMTATHPGTPAVTWTGPYWAF